MRKGTMVMANGVRLVSTVKPGRYAVVVTRTNAKHIERVYGRRQAIRFSQHASSMA